MTKECHKNKNMLLEFRDSYGYRQKMNIPSEIDDALLAKGMQKRPWSGHILAYIISFINPLTDKDVEELTLATKNSGWVLRQEHSELVEGYG